MTIYPFVFRVILRCNCAKLKTIKTLFAVWSKTIHFDSNRSGKRTETHRFCPLESLITLKSAIKEGMKSKEMYSYFAYFVEKTFLWVANVAPPTNMRISRLRHALLTGPPTSRSYWTSITFFITNSISFCFLHSKKTTCCFYNLTFCIFHQILKFFSQGQDEPRRVTSNNIYKHDL